LIAEFGTGSPTLQQSLGRLLGQVDYQAYPQTAPAAIACLLESVDSTVDYDPYNRAAHTLTGLIYCLVVKLYEERRSSSQLLRVYALHCQLRWL
jgi:hypothetical protein